MERYMRSKVPFTALIMLFAFWLFSTPGAQICNGSKLLSAGADTGTNCPGTTQTRSQPFNATGSVACNMSGLGISYNLQPPGPTLNTNAVGTCLPGSAAQCNFTVPTDATTTGSDGTNFRLNWTNGVVVSGSCINQPAYAEYNSYQLSTCTGGGFCCVEGKEYCANGHGNFDDGSCSCISTPLLVVLSGRWQEAMTSASDGVPFALIKDRPAFVAWPKAGQQRVGWLARDRNGNGTIDEGSELYGSSTPQFVEPGQPLDGFRALALEDTNSDGMITEDDPSFALMTVWFDVNHDGRSQRDELVGLDDLGVRRLEVRPQPFHGTDARGNQFMLHGRGIAQRGASMRIIDLYDVVPQTAIMTLPTGGR